MHQFHRRLSALLLVWGCLLAADHAALAQSRVAVIDVKKVFDSYWKTKQADTNLKERARQLDQTRQRMLDDYKKAGTDYKTLLDSSTDPVLSATERARRKQNAERKLTELRELEQSTDQFETQVRRTLSEQQRLLRDDIIQEIRNKVAVKARQRGYTMVLDSAAETINQTPMMIFTNGENDITSEIIAELNAASPPPAPALAPAATRFPTTISPSPSSSPSPSARPVPTPAAPPFQPGTFRK